MSNQENSTDENYDALASLVFELDATYDIGLTNSPDSHPGIPTISDFYKDLLDGICNAGFLPVKRPMGDDNEL